MNVQAWGTGVGILVAVAAFVRFLPKKKLCNLVSGPCYMAGVAVSKFLILRIGSKAAERVEEGVLLSVVAAVETAAKQFQLGMWSDNDAKKGGKQ